MQIKSNDLIAALTAVKPGLAKKAIVEQATHFVFTQNEILTYNDRICISYPFKTDFQCSVPADEFHKILVNLNQENVDLELKQDKLMIKCGKTKAGLATATGGEILDIVKSLNLEKMRETPLPLPKDFLEGVALCMFSASKDQTNQILTCLFIEDKYIASTDDFRISEYVMESDIDCSTLIPSSSIAELIKFDVCRYNKDGAWIYFFTDSGVCFCSRVTLGKFPLYEDFFGGFDQKEIRLPADLKQTVLTSAILTEGETDTDKEVEIEIDKKKLRCKGQNRIGWVETELDIETEHTIKFAINPSFFIKILGHTQSMYFGGNKALFKSKNFRHIIALKAS